MTDVLSLPDDHMPCPLKQTEDCDCQFHSARGPVICNGEWRFVKDHCPLWGHMATLRDLVPELWTGEVCCPDFRVLMLRCAESDGYMRGAIDIRYQNSDGKNVWRNFYRLKLAYCPFCGAKQPERKIPNDGTR